MARKEQKRPKRLNKRRRPIHEQNKVVLIVCEGKETEPQYFGGLNIKWRFVTIKVITVRGNDPVGIVKRAIKEKKGSKDFDEIWCVFDTEGDKDSSEITKAKEIAQKNKIELAISHPCFDFWLLLHFEFTSRPFANCGEVVDYIEDNGYMQKGYKSNLPKQLYADTHLEKALEHAKQLRDDTLTSNPATDVDLLVEQLKSFHDEQNSIRS